MLKWIGLSNLWQSKTLLCFLKLIFCSNSISCFFNFAQLRLQLSVDILLVFLLLFQIFYHIIEVLLSFLELNAFIDVYILVFQLKIHLLMFCDILVILAFSNIEFLIWHIGDLIHFWRINVYLVFLIFCSRRVYDWVLRTPLNRLQFIL